VFNLVPWFATMKSAWTMWAHVVFGAICGGTYELLEKERFVVETPSSRSRGASSVRWAVRAQPRSFGGARSCRAAFAVFALISYMGKAQVNPVHGREAARSRSRRTRRSRSASSRRPR
jgi:hypothetical protein